MVPRNRGVPRREPVANGYSDNSASETRSRRGYPGFQDEIEWVQQVYILEKPGYTDNPFSLTVIQGHYKRAAEQCILRFDVETRTIRAHQSQTA